MRLRPHTKTHKSPVLAHMQVAAGAIGLPAPVGRGQVRAEAVLKDILIANQIVGAGKIARLVNLAAFTEVMVAVDDAANVEEALTAPRVCGRCVADSD